MQTILKDVKITNGNIICSHPIQTKRVIKTSIQMVVNSNESQDSDARGYLQVSNNGTDWFNLALLETSGTGLQKDGGLFEAIWAYTRFRLEQTPEHGPGRVSVYITLRDS